MQRLETLPPPPGVIASLQSGFNIVSAHIALILMPVALDVFLWLGPRLSVDKLLSPFFKYMLAQVQQGMDASVSSQLSGIMDVLQNFNLFSLLSRSQLFPIGIFSLAAQTLPVQTPFGSQTVIEISSTPVLLGLWILLIPIGWIGGGLYYRQVAGSTLGESDAVIGSGRAVLQTLLFCLVWFIFLMIVIPPVVLVVGALGLISPMLASLGLLIVAFFFFLLVVPLFFTPHGIFVHGQNVFHSIFASLRMSRFTLPTSGMFVFSAFLLYSGMNYLWGIPDGGSWLMLIGIIGHAFIATMLLAASFVYYRDMNNWLQNVYERLQQLSNQSSIRKA